MAQNPPVSAFRRDNIDAIFNLGMIAIDMRQPKAAERCYDIAFPIIEGKIAESDDAFEWKLYYASWFVTVCRVFQQVGDKALLGKYFEKGKKALKEAIKLKSEFAAKHPEMMQVQHDLMVMYNDFADLSHANGLDEDAVSYYDNALAISGRLADAHKDQVAVAILPSICLERLGRLYRDKNDLKKAGEYFAQSLEARKKLAEKNPQDVRLLHDLATANNNMAALYADAADKAPAEDYLIGQLDALTKVNQLQPNEASVANVLDAIIALGDYYFITEKGKEALHTYQQALKVIEPLRSRQVSESLLNRIAGVHYKCGMSQIFLKEEKVGRDNLNIASQLWHQLLQATGNSLYKKEFDEAQKELNKFN
jgi:tetratricopeptide (TPR) repeat protein